jgi:hypothetical protein
MVIDHRHVLGMPLLPSEHQPPLVIDPDRVIPLPAPPEKFQTIPGWDSQVVKLGSVMQVEQFASCSLQQTGRKPPDFSGPSIKEQVFGKPIPEALNHFLRISRACCD